MGSKSARSADLVVLDAVEPDMAVAELAPVLYAFKRGRMTVSREPARLIARHEYRIASTIRSTRFAATSDVGREGNATGPLLGCTFAVKDVFDIAGSITGNGHPLWLETHPPAERTASAVERLLAAGARLVGKTHLR